MINNKIDRRDFLKLLGFTITVSAIASCEGTIDKTIPYLIKPQEIVPGIANYYASSFFDGHDFASILVKTREGRPIKIEGNDLSKLTFGKSNARIQASILSLYDNNRLQKPSYKSENLSWNEIDNLIIEKLINSKNKNNYLLSKTVISPSSKKIINNFCELYNFKHIQYDIVSFSQLLKSNEIVFKKRTIPSYKFDKAKTVVSFNADFLANWLNPIEFNVCFSEKREKKKLTQFENIFSLTGANADKRIACSVNTQKSYILALLNKLNSSYNIKFDNSLIDTKILEQTANDLIKNKETSIVICGNNDIDSQIAVNLINYELGNYDNTIFLDEPIFLKQSDDNEVFNLIDEIKKDNIDSLIFWDTNPVYNFFNGAELSEHIKKIPLTISLNRYNDETTNICKFSCPDNHYLESWGDCEPKKNHFSLTQPVIKQLFSTRMANESLLKWSNNNSNSLAFIKQYWEKELFSKQIKYLDFTSFWNNCLYDGVFEQSSNKLIKENLIAEKKSSIEIINKTDLVKNYDYELMICEGAISGNGESAYNPWLLELPDPITKTSWDYYATVSPKLNFNDGDIITIIVNNKEVKVPIINISQQNEKTIGLRLGFGKNNLNKFLNNIGINASEYVSYNEGFKHYSSCKIVNTKNNKNLVKRKEFNLKTKDIFKKSKLFNNNNPELWGIVIDLKKCTGCSTCVISCQAENNIPIVGKEDVNNKRLMHWVRIDNLYKSDGVYKIENKVSKITNSDKKLSFLPIMCQHCNNAPCESVCPVIATTHSKDGLNHMVYGRCIGSRYCMVNCPYQVRSFNWKEYSKEQNKISQQDSAISNMHLNPDVTVRTRGVSEKCSLCIQRIQEGRLKAKKENRPVEDGDINIACASSCPSGAIIFGNVNNKSSKIHKVISENDIYTLLGDLETMPSVHYILD